MHTLLVHKILTSINFEFRSKDANVSSFSGVCVFVSGGEVYLSKACANPLRFFSLVFSTFINILSISSTSLSVVEKHLFK